MDFKKEVIDILVDFLPQAGVEGMEIDIYKDATGNWTYGVGHKLNSRTYNESFRELRMEFPDIQNFFSKESAITVLKSDLEEVYPQLLKLIEVDLNPFQFAAILSFAFNIGIVAFKNSTFLRKINQEKFDEALSQLSLWNKGTINGKKVILSGLVNRRKKEKDLFLREK